MIHKTKMLVLIAITVVSLCIQLSSSSATCSGIQQTCNQTNCIGSCNCNNNGACSQTCTYTSLLKNNCQTMNCSATNRCTQSADLSTKVGLMKANSKVATQTCKYRCEHMMCSGGSCTMDCGLIGHCKKLTCDARTCSINLSTFNNRSSLIVCAKDVTKCTADCGYSCTFLCDAMECKVCKRISNSLFYKCSLTNRDCQYGCKCNSGTSSSCKQICSSYKCSGMECSADEKCVQETDTKHIGQEVISMKASSNIVEQVCRNQATCKRMTCLARSSCNTTCGGNSYCENMVCSPGTNICDMNCIGGSRCPQMTCDAKVCRITSKSSTSPHNAIDGMQCSESSQNCSITCLDRVCNNMKCHAKNCIFNCLGSSHCGESECGSKTDRCDFYCGYVTKVYLNCKGKRCTCDCPTKDTCYIKWRLANTNSGTNQYWSLNSMYFHIVFTLMAYQMIKNP